MTQTNADTKTPVKTITPTEEVQNVLMLNIEEFRKALPSHITPDKFLRVAMTAIQGNPDLLTKCTRQSLYLAFKLAAQDGLLPDDREGTIIPYKGNAEWTPMVAGICKKARNSGEVSTMNAIVVFENDKFEAWEDEKGPHFKHVPAFTNRGEVLLTFAYAIMKDGSVYAELVDRDQMAAIEAASATGDSFSPWKTKFRTEMMRKSALRRLCKYRMPSSTDLDELVRSDDKFYDLEKETKAAHSTDTSNRLRAAIDVVPAAPAATSKPEPLEAMKMDFKLAMDDANDERQLDNLVRQVNESKLTDESKELLQIHAKMRLKKILEGGQQ